jgi:hypothetical protein
MVSDSGVTFRFIHKIVTSVVENNRYSKQLEF